MATKFDDFMKEIEQEAKAEGTEAVAELEAMTEHFKAEKLKFGVYAPDDEVGMTPGQIKTHRAFGVLKKKYKMSADDGAAFRATLNESIDAVVEEYLKTATALGEANKRANEADAALARGRELWGDVKTLMEAIEYPYSQFEKAINRTEELAAEVVAAEDESDRLRDINKMSHDLGQKALDNARDRAVKAEKEVSNLRAGLNKIEAARLKTGSTREKFAATVSALHEVIADSDKYEP